MDNKEIQEFEILDGSFAGCIFTIPERTDEPVSIVLMKANPKPELWDELVPEKYSLVMMPKTESSNDFVPCYMLDSE